MSRQDAGVTTDKGFYGSQSSRLFVSIARPSIEPRSGIVICPPLHADFAKNYRNEVSLAEALARQGHAVVRFHYRGQGHSDGDPRRMNYESLTADAAEAAELLQVTLGVEALGFVGCRLGAFVAASVAALHDGAPLALWEPVSQPAKYLRDAIRARMIGRVTGASATDVTAAGLSEQLRTEGSLDIYGYPIYLDLVESLEGKELLDQLGESSRPILLIQISARGELSSAYASFVRDAQSRGLAVSTHNAAGTVGWWFRGGRQDQPDLLTDEMVSTTADWFGLHMDPLGALA